MEAINQHLTYHRRTWGHGGEDVWAAIIQFRFSGEWENTFVQGLLPQGGFVPSGAAPNFANFTIISNFQVLWGGGNLNKGNVAVLGQPGVKAGTQSRFMGNLSWPRVNFLICLSWGRVWNANFSDFLWGCFCRDLILILKAILPGFPSYPSPFVHRLSPGLWTQILVSGLGLLLAWSLFTLIKPVFWPVKLG